MRSSAFDRIVSLVALFASAIALLLSWQANLALEEANRLSLPKVEIVHQATAIPPHVYQFDCFRTSYAQYERHTWTGLAVTFANNGGRSVSLINAIMVFSGGYMGLDTIARDSERISLPATIAPGEAETLNFVYHFVLIAFSEGELSPPTPLEPFLGPNTSPTWMFQFSDGTSLSSAYQYREVVRPNTILDCSELDSVTSVVDAQNLFSQYSR